MDRSGLGTWSVAGDAVLWVSVSLPDSGIEKSKDF